MQNSTIDLPIVEIRKGSESNSLMNQGDKYVKYKEAFNEADRARSLINTRIEKLKYESEILKQIGRNNIPLKITPNMFTYQPVEPVYYPLENPLRGEPVSLPKIEMGMPVEKLRPEMKKCKKQCGFSISDLMALLGMFNMGNRNSQCINDPRYFQMNQGPPFQINGNENELPIKGFPRKALPITRKSSPALSNYLSTNAKLQTPIQNDLNKLKIGTSDNFNFDWWKVVRNFVNMYKFFSVSRKYGKNANIRDPVLNEITKSVYGHIDSIANWLLSIQDSFIDELKVYNNLNLNFTESNNKFNFKRCSEIIVAVLTKFLTNLYSRSGRLIDLPEKVQETLYNYIKEKAYLPRKYLSTYEINRLDFYFYGGLKNVTEFQAAMILAFLIISRCMVQKIFLLPTQSMPQFKNFNNIKPTCYILGSVMHYLVKGAFNSSPPMVKEFLALLNYYRNYHLFKNEIELQSDIFNVVSFNYEDTDEISKNLIPEGDLNEFWKENANWVSWFKQKIFNWAVNMAKLVNKKFKENQVAQQKRKTIANRKTLPPSQDSKINKLIV